MTVPTAGFISSLDPENPSGTNFVFEGDDWLRFLQKVMKTNQFPRSEDDSSNGWDIACTAKCSQLNALDDLVTTETVETRLSTLEAESAKFPGGGVTFIAFYQISAPTGWTQQTGTKYDNAMLRVVNTAGGGDGGSASPIEMTASDVPSHTHGFDTPSGGNHNHGAYQNVTGGSDNRIFFQYNIVSNSAGLTELYTDNNTQWYIINQQGVHTHPSGTTDPNSGSSSWTPKYIDMIIASKD